MSLQWEVSVALQTIEVPLAMVLQVEAHPVVLLPEVVALGKRK